MRLLKYIVLGALAPFVLAAFMLWFVGAFAAAAVFVSGLVGVSEQAAQISVAFALFGAALGALVYWMHNGPRPRHPDMR